MESDSTKNVWRCGENADAVKAVYRWIILIVIIGGFSVSQIGYLLESEDAQECWIDNWLARHFLNCI